MRVILGVERVLLLRLLELGLREQGAAMRRMEIGSKRGFKLVGRKRKEGVHPSRLCNSSIGLLFSHLLFPLVSWREPLIVALSFFETSEIQSNNGTEGALC